jgi:hypothetical protein
MPELFVDNLNINAQLHLSNPTIPMPRRDSISRPVSSVAEGDDTTRLTPPGCAVKTYNTRNRLERLKTKISYSNCVVVVNAAVAGLATELRLIRPSTVLK